jgi:short-subunit dehydrogenase
MQTLNSGHWALITGASSGLGVEFAHLLAARRMNLVLAARGVADMERLADTLRSAHGIEVVVEGIDLAEPGAAAVLKQRTDVRGLRIDVLINNAGYGVHGRFIDADPARIRGMLQLNMVTLTELTHLYAEDMVKRGRGRILLVASLLGYMTAPTYAGYAATKHYVLALGEALHDELAPAGVTVTVLSPGVTKTAFFEASGHRVSATLKLMTMPPRPVAETGIRAMMAGRASVVPGWANKLSAWSTRITPRSVQRKIMQALMS